VCNVSLSARSALHVTHWQRDERLSARRQDCLALGVIFAATDSVAVLQARPARPRSSRWLGAAGAAPAVAVSRV
jgi:hypothetical protein